MTEGQKNRLLGTLVALEQIRAQIARAARDGQSPAQSGRSLTPLPQESWREIEASLERVYGHARALAEQFAGDALQDREARDPVGATLYWISFLARRLDEEAIADLSPGRMAQFGKLPEDAAAALEEAMERMRMELASAGKQVEALRQEKGTEGAR